MAKVKLSVHYGEGKPGDTVDIKAAEAEHLISTRQAVEVEDSEPKAEDKKPQRKAGEGRES